MKASIIKENDRKYLVADDNGKIIGVIGYKTPDTKMLEFSQTQNPTELVNAYVDPEQRKGRGVGRSLVSSLEQSAANDGFTEIILNSGQRYKETGWGFYDRLPGFSRIGIAKNYYGEGGDAPVWSKILEEKTNQ